MQLVATCRAKIEMEHFIQKRPKTGGRTAGTPNKTTTAVREETIKFFQRIIDDEVEAKFWRFFITGYQEHVKEDGTLQLIKYELDPISFSAFKRAVEYKRGLPVQPVERVDTNVPGLGMDFFDGATEGEAKDATRLC